MNAHSVELIAAHLKSTLCSAGRHLDGGAMSGTAMPGIRWSYRITRRHVRVVFGVASVATDAPGPHARTATPLSLHRGATGREAAVINDGEDGLALGDALERWFTEPEDAAAIAAWFSVSPPGRLGYEEWEHSGRSALHAVTRRYAPDGTLAENPYAVCPLAQAAVAAIERRCMKATDALRAEWHPGGFRASFQPLNLALPRVFLMPMECTAIRISELRGVSLTPRQFILIQGAGGQVVRKIVPARFIAEKGDRRKFDLFWRKNSVRIHRITFAAPAIAALPTESAKKGWTFPQERKVAEWLFAKLDAELAQGVDIGISTDTERLEQAKAQFGHIPGESWKRVRQEAVEKYKKYGFGRAGAKPRRPDKEAGKLN